MRKIWIVIPFGASNIAVKLFTYVSFANAKCVDVNTSYIWSISDEFKTGLSVNKDGSYDFFTKEKIICTVKQINVDMQDFPDVPNAKIKEQPTSY